MLTGKKDNPQIIISTIILMIAFMSLVACQSVPETKNLSENNNTGSEQSLQTNPSSNIQAEDKQQIDVRSREAIVEIGTGEYVGQVVGDQVSNSSEPAEITLSFQDTDLKEFVKAIFSDVLKENYILDPSVTGKVTVQTTTPITRSAVFDILENILGMNNATIIINNGVYQLIPKNQALGRDQISTSANSATAGGYTTRLIPLRFISALEMEKILKPFVTEGSNLRIDNKRNLVIISGTGQQIDSVQQTIDIFDVDWLRGMSVGLYPLDYVDPNTLKKELDAIISGIDGQDGNGLLGGMVRTVPLERLNSLLLIGSTASALREVEIWMRRLDKPGDHAGKRLYVYNLQNAKATELSEILNNIFKNGTTTATTSQIVAPGLEPVEITNQSQSEPSPNSSSTPGSIAINPNTSVEIIADDVRNALVILASQQEYQMVEAAISKLDIVPLQVLIEASIIEVTLDDNLNYGVEWFFKNRVDNTYQGQGRLDLGNSGISAISPAFSYTVINNAADVRVALNALASESNIKVLSSPSLMVLDNKTATINIGDEIPVPTRQSISTIDPEAPTINEIQFRKTGVTLTVTPRVNMGGLVTMAIRQEVSNAVTTTSSSIDAPTIQQRQIESEVAINSGETIVLGGLIQDTKSKGNTGIPGLRNIPLIGSLFSQSSDETHRTELLVLITPRVVGNRKDARDITEEFRRKLQDLAPVSKNSS